MGNRHRLLITGLLAALPFVTPARASADFLVSPFVGVAVVDSDNRKTTFGGAVGFAAGPLGLEFEAARTLLGSYTDIPVVDLNARVSTYMGNLMLRLPAGFFQPYVSGGGGIVRLTGSVDVPFVGSVFSVSAEDFGWNVGAGLMLFPVPGLGIRGEVRRFQTGDISWDDITDIDGLGDLPLPKVNFWRATAGLTLKF